MNLPQIPLLPPPQGRAGCLSPSFALVCGERWGKDKTYGRTSVVRTPRANMSATQIIKKHTSHRCLIEVSFHVSCISIINLFTLLPASKMTIDLQANGSTSPTLDLVSRVEELLQRQVSNPRQRMLVALAGVPGSGKSTVSHDLLQALARRGIGNVSIVPMVSQSIIASNLSVLICRGRMVSITQRRYFRNSTIQRTH